MSMPGVQMPHCAPPYSRKACCSGLSASLCALGQTLYRANVRAVDLTHRHQAGIDDHALDDDGAGAALALAATLLGAGQSQVFTHDVEQPSHAWHRYFASLTVEREAVGRARSRRAIANGRHSPASMAASTRSAVAGSSVIQTPTASWMASTMAGRSHVHG